MWHDQNGDGEQTAPEFPFSDDVGFNNVAVYLYPITATVTSTTCGATGYLTVTHTISGTSQTPDGFPDGIYYFDMGELGYEPGDYWVCVDENTLPNPGDDMEWSRTTDNPQEVNYTGDDDFSFDFGYEAVAEPTAVTLSSFAARPSAGGVVNPLWLGLVGVTVLAAGSLFWAKRRVG